MLPLSEVSDYPTDPAPSPVLKDETPFNFVVYGLMVLYLLIVRFVDEKGTMYSFAIMLVTAVVWTAIMGDSVSGGLCRT